jgi:uroporphyrinogen-III synthase
VRVLVTRPWDDAQESARQLGVRGHQALLAPLLQTRFFDGPPLELDGVQAILATSANGVGALTRRSSRHDLPLFAVGPQTAQAAQDAGFQDVRSADGDARALAKATADWAKPGQGDLLHVSGEEIAGTLVETLRAGGFSVRREWLYAVEPLDLGAEAIEALKQQALDAALFFSPRSAAHFRDQVVKAALPTQKLVAVCISAATAAALPPLEFAQVRIANAPNQNALLACLD